MMTWLYSMISPSVLTAMEIFLLYFLVYGLGRQTDRENQKSGYTEDVIRPDFKRGSSLLILAGLFVLGVVLRTNRIDFGDSGVGSYVNIFTMSIFYYLVLTYYLRINQRLSFFYTVVFYIPMDVSDLIVFMAMLRQGGVDISGGNAELIPTLFYLMASFGLRFASLWIVRPFLDRDRRREPGNMQLFLIAIAVLPFLYMRDLGFWLPLGTDDIGSSSVLFLAVTGIITLILVIGNERIVYYHIQRNELLKMQHMINHQHELYEMRKEAVNLVNQKYHDMRHQLVGILSMEDVEQIHGYVNSLRKEIQPLENFFRTGHQLMDILLADKAEECRKKQIQLIPTVDGQLLSMLEAADLCTIFGNALDNAIESCEKMPEEELRRITLKVCRFQGFLAIHMENSCRDVPRTEEGRILTSKKDTENHGFGLRGIRHAVEKYQGEMETEFTEGLFLLTVLIPLPEGKQREGALEK